MENRKWKMATNDKHKDNKHDNNKHNDNKHNDNYM
jgi:hypothetical protein